MKVRVVCTTDDPTDTLEHHLKLKAERGFAVKVLPAFRPDKVIGRGISEGFQPMGRTVGGFRRSCRRKVTIRSWRLSDDGTTSSTRQGAGFRTTASSTPIARSFTSKEVRGIFAKTRQRQETDTRWKP